MLGPAAQQARPSAAATLFTHACDRDTPLLAMPRAEIQVVARFGPAARGGLDVSAFGARQIVHRKVIRAGQWSVTARLPLGAQDAVLGAPVSALAGRVVALEDLWGGLATRRLCARLADACCARAAAAILERAIAERLDAADAGAGPAPLALAAADRLARANVAAVAADLGVSERHLRRVFRETVGLSPKAFARLARFDRAVTAARAPAHPSWASIAVDAGYYDQAHLIAEFRAIAGVTPGALLAELGDRAAGAWR